MSFIVRNLHVLDYAAGFTHWHYDAKTAPLSEIEALGFFNSAADMMAPGDTILISGAWGAAMRVVLSSGMGGVLLGRLS